MEQNGFVDPDGNVYVEKRNGSYARKSAEGGEKNPLVAVIAPVAWWFLCAGMGLTQSSGFHSLLPMLLWSSIYLFAPSAIARLNHATINKRWFYLGALGWSGWLSLAISTLGTLVWMLSLPLSVVHVGGGWHWYYLWYLVWPGGVIFAALWFAWRTVILRNQRKANSAIR